MRSHPLHVVAALVATWTLAPASFSQVSHGGTPPSRQGLLQHALQRLDLPSVNAAEARQQDLNPQPGQPLRYGLVVPLDFSAEEAGIWEFLDNGDLSWRLALRSQDAQSLSLVLSEFVVPPGAQLFVHGPGDARVLGSYTSEEANLDGSFSFEPVLGDELVLEYVEPADAPFHGRIRLESAIHDYRGLYGLMKATGLGASGACEVDVNCPAGSGYQNQKRAVVRLISNGFLCTGAMINNTANNGRRLMMTAHHCGTMNNAVLYFNFDRPSCGSGTPPTQTVSGTSQKAGNKNLDYRLVEVTPVIPATYNHYFLGWDRSGATPSSTVCIHHPAGDAKKISFDNHAPTKTSNSWQINQWDLGVTEGGSSGSPLMTPAGLFIGQLWGGQSYCGFPYNDYYRRFDLAWSGVRSYLDPTGSNATSIGGFDPP
ncbi:MAG: hypothetical protein JNJ88_15530 [Planctomycetes bacterium]|nr:hypothetical protein [Planctomycetota bacterium]